MCSVAKDDTYSDAWLDNVPDISVSHLLTSGVVCTDYLVGKVFFFISGGSLGVVTTGV
jgi:hypothetical protein